MNNKVKQPMTRVFNKKREKEIRSAQAISSIAPPPRKVAAPEPLPLAAPKNASKHHKTSKRTTPGSVRSKDSSPKHPHIEGERWAKTLTLQNKNNSRLLVKQLAKRDRKQSPAFKQGR